MRNEDGVLRPDGGVDERKFVLCAYANALLRDAILDVLRGEEPMELLRELYENTSLANQAAACGYAEGDLAISWSDFLTSEEKEAVRCGAR